MKLSEWVITLVEALAVGLFWGGLYFVVDEFFHPTQNEKYGIVIVVLVIWFIWASKKRQG